MDPPQEKPCQQMSDDYLFKASRTPLRPSHKERPCAKKNLNIMFTTEELLLDEACARNRIIITCYSESSHFPFLHLNLAEKVQRYTVHHEAFCSKQTSITLLQAQLLDRKIIRTTMACTPGTHHIAVPIL